MCRQVLGSYHKHLGLMMTLEEITHVAGFRSLAGKALGQETDIYAWAG